jgi:hypothetical protein
MVKRMIAFALHQFLFFMPLLQQPPMPQPPPVLPLWVLS